MLRLGLFYHQLLYASLYDNTVSFKSYQDFQRNYSRTEKDDKFCLKQFGFVLVLNTDIIQNFLCYNSIVTDNTVNR